MKFWNASLPALTLWLGLSVQIASAAPAALPAADAAEKTVRDKVAEISADRTPDEVRAEIAKWKRRDPESAEPYIVSASYELSLSRQPTALYSFETHGVPRLPARAGTEWLVIDPKSGQEVAVVGEAPTGAKPDAETVRKQQAKAAAKLEEALQKFPDRLDLMKDRCIVLAEARDWKPLATQIERALERAVRDPENLRWRDNHKPPFPPADEVLNGLQSIIKAALEEREEVACARARQFAKLGLKYFPRDVRLICDLGNSYAALNRWDLGLSYFEEARRIAPEDSVVLWSVAEAYRLAGRADEAGTALNEIVRLNLDPLLVAGARERLRDAEEAAKKQP